jgi:glycosyltransferase involved in cell wall biosynthesis
MKRAGRSEPFPASVVALLGGFVTVGGAERMTFASLRLFRERGSKVHCIVNDWENEAVVAEAEKIGATWSEGSYRKRLRLRNRSIRQITSGAISTIGTSRGLLKEASQHAPDVIFASDFEAVLRNASALFLLRSRGVRVVMYLQNAPPSSAPYRHLFRWILNPLVTRFVTASGHSASVLAGHGVSPSKISCVNNFAPSRENIAPAAPRDPKKVIFVGQMIPQKGLDVLLDAFASVAAEDTHATLDVVSRIDGWIAPEYAAHRERVLARVKADDLRERVSLLGWRDDVPRLLAAAAVHCAPSRPEMNEGMPLVCLEAKCAGTPSVAPSAGPFPEMITHGVDGWLCNELTAGSLAEGLRYFLDDPVRARKAGDAASSSSGRFSRSEFDRRWQSVFEMMR